MLEQRKLLILYGSQTGTAQDVAERMCREAKRRMFSTKVLPLDEFQIGDLIHQELAIFVCSTTGQGDPPDNMRKFWNFIMRRSIPQNSLLSLKYAVLGLGDSSYQKFNFVAKKLCRRLALLGATSLVPVGLADDQHDLGADAVVNQWSEKLWNELMTIYPLPSGVDIISKDVCPPPRYKVKILPPAGSGSDLTNYRIHDDKCNIFYAKLISNERLTSPDHFQDVRLIRLDITNSHIQYSPGDVVMIKPQNSLESVNSFINHMKLEKNCYFSLAKNDPDIEIPSSLPPVCSAQYLLQHYLDINSVPRRSFFEFLLYFAKDELEKEKLQEFCSAEGQEELYSYCYRVKRTILETLKDFPHASSSIPLEYLFDVIPPMQPRAFSIASSLKAHPNEIQVIMAVVEYKTKLFYPRKGVCSTWLAGLDSSQEHFIPIWTRKSTIRLPKDVDSPLIMVGPGTGVAPFRSFIQERVMSGIKGNYLFFGCRGKDKDFYFDKEWEKYTEMGSLELFTAFSRDQEDKVYVQHRIQENGKLIWNLLCEQKANVYVAGNAKQMPDAVRDAIKDSISKYGHKSKEEAEDYLKDLDKNKRYQAETWS